MVYQCLETRIIRPKGRKKFVQHVTVHRHRKTFELHFFIKYRHMTNELDMLLVHIEISQEKRVLAKQAG